jgi:hypothetical protein
VPPAAWARPGCGRGSRAAAHRKRPESARTHLRTHRGGRVGDRRPALPATCKRQRLSLQAAYLAIRRFL